MLRLGGLLGIKPVHLSKQACENWLRSLVVNPVATEGLPVLEVVSLAAIALMDLGSSPDPNSLAASLDRLRTDGLYSWDGRQKPDWTATARATQALRAAGVSIPSAVAASTASELAGATGLAVSPEEGLDVLLPIWQVADATLPMGQREPLLPLLRQRLESLVLASDGPANPANLSVLSAVKDLVQDNHMSLRIPSPDTSALEQPDGLLSMDSSGGGSDAQMTWKAARLGWTASDRTRDTVVWSAAAAGWPTAGSEPNPESTYYGVVVGQSSKLHLRLSELRVQANTWLAQIAAGATIASREIYFSLALARALGMPIQSSVVAALRTKLTSVREIGSDALSYAAMASIVDLTLPADLSRASIGAFPFKSVPEAYSAWMWGVALRLPAICSSAAQAVANYRTASGAVQSQQGLPVDLFSTAVDRRIGSALEDGVAAAAVFADSHGFWHFQPGTGSGNVVDLQGQYLGLFVSGATDDASGVF